jgi:probable rRNA maturation factor
MRTPAAVTSDVNEKRPMTILVKIDRRAWRFSRSPERLARRAARAALNVAGSSTLKCDLSIIFASDSAVSKLNGVWRGRNSPTNVLSFTVPWHHRGNFVGDVVLASGVLKKEAKAQGKNLTSHAAHLIVHGVLHLLGYDHHESLAARKMERMEIRALKSLGITNPYR